ncbi:F0F1 ATP synthase subunit epsilon [Roseibium aggregatum]|uniref:ATP synthase epsilon chain n=1 Tax=Roseibium aggregatum TaxID=187304 RepID=A0A926P4X4_9HYPH|nr:F0F1 ATP synthase subunit epsilon [Roseibium aggregatum]MBD1547721.1 F0F1 ATP synthase subunit epsilon [Roseibium aggregatum]
MAELFQFELVSPERQLLSEQVLEVIVPGTEGEFGVLKDHSPFMSTIQAGILRVRREQGAAADEYFVRGGFADVATGGLTVLAEQAVPVADLKVEHLDEQIKNAEEDVADAKDTETLRKAQDTLARLIDIRESMKKI